MQTYDDPKRPVFSTDYLRGDESSVASPSNVSENWDEQTKRLTHEVREIIPDSVTEFVANLKNADIRVELCSPGEESSMTTRTVLSAESQDDGQEKLSQLSQIAVGIRNHQLTVEQSGEDEVGGSYEIEVSGSSSANNLAVKISNVVAGDFVFSGNTGRGNNLRIGGREINLDQVSSGSTISAVQKREVIFRVKPEAMIDYELSTARGLMEISSGKGRAFLSVGKGKISVDNFSGDLSTQVEAGSITANQVGGDLTAKIERGSITVGSVDGAAKLVITEAGDISIQSTQSTLTAKIQRGSIAVGTTGGQTTLETQAGSITANQVGGDLITKIGRGSITVGSVDGAAKLATEAGNITIQSVRSALVSKIQRGSIAVGTTGGQTTLEIQAGSITANQVGGDLSAKIERGSIAVGSVDGAAKLATEAGDISIEIATGEVIAQTERGSITAQRLQLHGKSNRFTTESGSIEVGVANFDIVLEASAESGTITTEGMIESQRTDQRGRNTKVKAYSGNPQSYEAATLTTSTARGNIAVTRL